MRVIIRINISVKEDIGPEPVGLEMPPSLQGIQFDIESILWPCFHEMSIVLKVSQKLLGLLCLSHFSMSSFSFLPSTVVVFCTAWPWHVNRNSTNRLITHDGCWCQWHENKKQHIPEKTIWTFPFRLLIKRTVYSYLEQFYSPRVQLFTIFHNIITTNRNYNSTKHSLYHSYTGELNPLMKPIRYSLLLKPGTSLPYSASVFDGPHGTLVVFVGGPWCPTWKPS